MSSNFGRGQKVDADGIYGVDLTGEYRAVAVDNNGHLLVNVASSSSVTATQIDTKTVAITTGAGQQILAANASRAGFILTNNSTVTAYLGKADVTEGSTAASATAGIALPGGASFAVDGTEAQFAYYGTTQAGTTYIGVMESLV